MCVYTLGMSKKVEPAPKPTVLFVCVHNAGRSQMAAGYLQHFAGDRVTVLSAGSEPKDQINPTAVEAMAEEGVINHDDLALFHWVETADEAWAVIVKFYDLERC